MRSGTLRHVTTDTDSGPETRWDVDTPCGHDPDLYWRDGRVPIDAWRAQAGRAVHQCLVHCPSLIACRDRAADIAVPGCVLGGHAWAGDSDERRTLRVDTTVTPTPCGHCHTTRRAA